MEINYTIVNAPLVNLVLVAGTDHGVCAVTFGEDETVLAYSLHMEHPQTGLRRNGGNVSTWVGKILEYLSGTLKYLDLPVDIQGTAFQFQVWEELRKIPYGETRTYAQVAKSLGRPSAVRAVARACATNPAALIYPCHRVVRSDGGLSGYRWGIDRKRILLAYEREHRNSI